MVGICRLASRVTSRSSSPWPPSIPFGILLEVAPASCREFPCPRGCRWEPRRGGELANLLVDFGARSGHLVIIEDSDAGEELLNPRPCLSQ